MTRDGSAPLTVGDLRIIPDTGEVRNSLGRSVRLSPVNMKILAHLANQSGRVVLRGEIFDLIWKNQSVSDDALTRCVSDIRSELAKLSNGRKYIDTIPKRGYRWNPSAGKSVASEWASPVSIRRGLLYAVALVVIASLGTWLAVRLSPAEPPIVVVMPTQSDASQRSLAAVVEQQLTVYFANLDQVGLLSKTAAQTTAIDPFSYFYSEFGVQWLIESELHAFSDGTMITIGLVDARAGIVLFQISDRLPPGDRPESPDFDRILEPLQEFIQAQSAP